MFCMSATTLDMSHKLTIIIFLDSKEKVSGLLDLTGSVICMRFFSEILILWSSEMSGRLEGFGASGSRF